MFLHNMMCNEMWSKTTSSRRSGIIHARQLGLCTRCFGQHWKHRCINIFQEEISKLQVFLQISFDYLDFSQQSFLQKWAASVFSEFSIIFYFLDATAIFLNFPASFLYFCTFIGSEWPIWAVSESHTCLKRSCLFLSFFLTVQNSSKTMTKTTETGDNSESQIKQ